MSPADAAAVHRTALIGIGWTCGPIGAYGDEIGFEVLSGAAAGRPIKPHRRTFAADGSMTVTRH